MLTLTKDNYFSPEADRDYFSVSQYLDFLKCEAYTMAKLRGEWQDAPNDAFLLGSLVHAWNEGHEAFVGFMLDNPEMYSSKGPTKGELKAPYKIAERMIKTLENDEFCMFCLTGEKEVVFAAEMFGVWWKIRIDSWNAAAGFQTDLKTTKSINELLWMPGVGKVSFVEAYHYPLRMAIYSEVERLANGTSNWLEPLIVAVSKEDPPDKAVISLNDPARLNYELEQVADNLPRLVRVKNGDIHPQRCGKCEYCRATKRVLTVTYYTEVGMNY